MFAFFCPSNECETTIQRRASGKDASVKLVMNSSQTFNARSACSNRALSVLHGDRRLVGVNCPKGHLIDDPVSPSGANLPSCELPVACCRSLDNIDPLSVVPVDMEFPDDLTEETFPVRRDVQADLTHGAYRDFQSGNVELKV